MNDSHFWGTGWSFPPTFDLANQKLQMVQGESTIAQSIDIILSTLRGERSLMPDYGSDLGSFLFKNIDDTTQGEIALSVKQGLLDNESRIDVNDVTVSAEQDSENTLLVNIQYTIIRTNSRHNHVFPFSVSEGTNLPAHYRGR